jgi:hypothetical protein
VAELVGDVADGEAGVVEAGGDGVADGVAGDPGVAGAVEGGAQVGLGVRRVSVMPAGGREHHPARPGNGGVRFAASQHVQDWWRQGEDALGGRGLGAWLDAQASPGDPHDGGVDVDGAGVEVEHRATNGSGFAYAHPGAEHELHEVGQVQSARFVVVVQPGLQVARFGGGEGADLTGGAGDGLGVAYRVVWDGAVADGVGAEAGQGTAGGAGGLWPVAPSQLAEAAVKQGWGELPQSQLAERGCGVQTGRGSVELPGAWGQRSGVEVGLSQRHDLAEPGPG